jgi:quinol monooxygenase YgiN
LASAAFETTPRLSREEFLAGVPLAEHVAQLPAHQPDLPTLLAEARLEEADVEPFRRAGVRYVTLFTEDWCPDSLHAVPLLVRLAEAMPEVEVRVWLRERDADFVNRVACERPPVPYVLFLNEAMLVVGRFVERPDALTGWMNEQSRHFRTRLRMEERGHVRRETLDGLKRAVSALPLELTTPDAPPSSPERALTVWEIWRLNEGAERARLDEVFRRHLPRVNAVPGMLLVEFAELRDRPGDFLALFRYADESYRAGFLASDAVRDMRKELDQLWTRAGDSTWAKAGVNPS